MPSAGSKQSRGGINTMAYSDDPVIPVKVETLFQDIKRDMSMLATNVSRISEGMYSKADKVELTKLEDKVEVLQRSGSDPARRAEKDVDDVRRRVELLERDSVKTSAVQTTERRLEHQERTSKAQWFAIVVTIVIGLIDIIIKLGKL